MKATMNAIIYARYSHQNQNEQAIDGAGDRARIWLIVADIIWHKISKHVPSIEEIARVAQAPKRPC